jgi:hypothetical protein
MAMAQRKKRRKQKKEKNEEEGAELMFYGKCKCTNDVLLSIAES